VSGMSEQQTLEVNIILDGELKQVLLHPCALCGDVLSDLDDQGRQVHVRELNGRFVCEACFQRLADKFGVETFDPSSSTPQITEISFGEFTVYTTLPPEKAIKQATEWYTDRFDDPLEEPTVRTVGSIIFTSDPRVIIIPEEDEDNE